jgi:hypothetical protein
MPGPLGGVRRTGGATRKENEGRTRTRSGLMEENPTVTTPEITGGGGGSGYTDTGANPFTPPPTEGGGGGGGGGAVPPPVTPPPVQAPAGPAPVLPAPPSPQMPAAPKTFAKPGTPGMRRFQGARMAPSFINQGVGMQQAGAMPNSVMGALSGGIDPRQGREDEQQTLGILNALQGGQ